jgi:RNA polymerase sigma-70 factor, ECF subfamily
VERLDTTDGDAREAAFVRLLTSHQQDIYLYVHSLVPNPNDAAEIVQNTNVILWEKRKQFDATRGFQPWAFQIARYELMKYRTKQGSRRVSFSDALIDELSVEATNCDPINADFIEDLRRCIAQLAASDREVLNQRYCSLASCDKIAQAVGRPVRWVYKALSRIRRELLDCMARHAAMRENP